MRIKKSFTIVKFISNYCHKITSKLFFGKEVEIVLNILNENIKKISDYFFLNIKILFKKLQKGEWNRIHIEFLVHS